MKRNIILLVLCLLIGGYYYFDTQYKEKQAEKEEQEKQLLTLETDDVKEVTIVKADETMKAVKTDDNWRLSLPFETSADKNNWDNVVSQFTSGERQRVVKENADNLASYGLDAPKVQITLAKENGAESATVKLGKETPTAGKYYAMIDGSSDVLTVLSSMHTAVDKSLFDFRDKNVLSFANENVQKIDVKHAGLEAEFERKGEEWQVTKPVNVRVNESKITDIMNAVKNSRIKMFVEEEPSSYEGYGLVEPATRIVLWTSEAGSEAGLSARVLLIGASSAMEDNYAMREGQKNVFTLSPQDFANIPKGIDELRQKKITTISSWEIERFEVESAGSTLFSASKENSEWLMLEPQQGNAMFSDVSGLTRDITGLELAKFVEGNKEDFSAEPAVSFHIETKDASDTIQLSGPREMDGEQFYFGTFENPLEIYAVSESSITGIINKAQAVKLDEPVEETNEGETTTLETTTQETITPETE